MSVTKLRCKVCGYAINAWWTDRKGHRNHNWERLRDHYYDEHPVEAATLADAIREWEADHLSELSDEEAS